MKSSVCWVSLAALALLTSASVALAADAPAAPAADSTVIAAPAATPAANAAPAAPAVSAPAAKAATPAAPMIGDRTGYGGVGGHLGLGDVLGSGDYSSEAQMRMSFSANWRYTFARSWRWQVSPGFVWAGYSKRSTPAPFSDPNFPGDPTRNKYKDQYLALVLPVSAQLQWVHRGGSLVWHLGAGPGVYRVWVENYRKVVRDPLTLKLHRGNYLGGSAEIGAEHFFKGLEATSLEITLDAHYIAAKRDTQFPSGFNDSVLAAGLRVGANYYFNLHAPPAKSSALPGIK